MARREEAEITRNWPENGGEPLVTVIAICYRHEEYLPAALDSVLAQETDFPFEVLAHDDASPDGSADIIREYAAAYPRIIRPILETENLFSKGYQVMMQAVMRHSRGKYLAYLECDDFWTDPHKLQEQADFLEGHPSFAATVHNCTVVDENGDPTGEPYPECRDTEYTMEHYLRGVLPGQFGTMVMRDVLANGLRDCPLILAGPPGPLDRVLYLTLLDCGRIHCIQKSMSAYRHITSGGASYSATYRFDLKREALYYRALMLHCKKMGRIGEALGIQRWFIDFLKMIEHRGDLTEEQAAPYAAAYWDSIASLSDRLARKKKRCVCCGQSVEYEPLPLEQEEELVSHGCLFLPETLNPEGYLCPQCKSTDRDRLAVSLLERLELDKKGSDYRILQLAPSPGLDWWLRTHCHDAAYETCDLQMDGVDFHADLQDMRGVADKRYDLIICFHVLEHVRDDRKALAEMKRILKDDGIVLFLVPIDLGFEGVDEAWGLSEEENWHRFAQEDHCRRYSRAGMLAHVGEEFSVLPLGKDFFGEEAFRQAGLTDSSTLYLLCKPEQAEKTAAELAALGCAERETAAVEAPDEPVGFDVMTAYVRGPEDAAFSEEKSARMNVALREDYYGAVPLNAFGEIEQLRVDPMDCACFLRELRVRLVRADGENLDVPVVWTNGIACAGGLLFDTDDPQLLLEIPRGRYRAVTLSCRQISGEAPGFAPLFDAVRELAERTRELEAQTQEHDAIKKGLRRMKKSLTRMWQPDSGDAEEKK